MSDSSDDEGYAPVARPKGKTASSAKATVEDTYTKTNLHEHVMMRPDTYIGSTEFDEEKAFVLNEAGDGFLQRKIRFVPGLFKLFDEVVVNAADNKQRDPSMSVLKVEVDPKTCMISVYNNGKGIPIERHPTHEVYVPELIFGHLLTSSNYNDTEKRTVGGRNGFGAKLANIFSTKFIVETCDGKKQYRQLFFNNMKDKKEPEITPAATRGESWTKITFYPDLKYFGMTVLDADIYELIRRRTYDMAGTCGKGLKVYFNGTSLKIKDFKDYCELYAPTGVQYERINDRWEIAIAQSDGSFSQVSFVNRIATLTGGTHVNAVADQCVKALIDKLSTKKLALKPAHVKNQLFVFVNALIENPTFNTQTKVQLSSKPASFGSKFALSEEFIKKMLKNKQITDAITSFALFQQDKELKKTDAKSKKVSRLTGIPKLEDANMAGTAKSGQCTLIITEGDSAKALAMAGLSVVGRDFYGVFPIRGKLLNVRDTAATKIADNAEITYLKQIIGLQQGRKYDSVDSLRYGHIMIMTDQDHDGSHIKGLIINMFAVFWPSLLKLRGFLTEFITPIVKVSKGKTSSNAAMSFYTLPEYQEWRESHNDGKGFSVKYYKGLGTSTAAEAKVYFTNIDTHQIPFSFKDDRCTQLIEMAFKRQSTDERKSWLQSFVPGTFLNHRVSHIPYQDFINRELILFSIASNQRAIPSLVDGLKPGQRKVLFACFKRKLTKELKVAQLAGYVAEQSAYHHGEASLAGTIVNLAQNYTGSNNINCLWPAGQFGTRASGGSDAASARYIFTYLSPVTRALFHPLDDPLLDYLNDDGQSIEPTFYVPILPMVLINGSSGIGTGWSSDVYNHDPRVVANNIRRMLKGLEPEEMHPWYKGFIGEIAVRGTRRAQYMVRGLYEVSSDKPCTVHIYELPIGVWTSDYKENLDALAKKGEVLEFAEYHSDVSVSFSVTFSQEAWDRGKSNLRAFLKLETTISTSNMVLFDAKGQIVKYDSTLEIIRQFFPIRLDLYGKRKQYMIDTVKKDLAKISSKVRFILDVVEKRVELRNVKRAELLSILQQRGYERIIPEKKPPTTAADAVANVGADNSDDEEDETASSSTSASADNVTEKLKAYTYLTSMPLLSLTLEKVQELTREERQKQADLARLEATTAESMWIQDLDDFEVALDAHEALEQEELRAGELAKAGRSGAAGRGKKGKAVDDGSDDEYNDRKPVKGAKGAKKGLQVPDWILRVLLNRPKDQTFVVEEETAAERKKREAADAKQLAKLSGVAGLLGIDLDSFGGDSTPSNTPKTKTTKGTRTLKQPKEPGAVKAGRGRKMADSEDEFDSGASDSDSGDGSDFSGGSDDDDIELTKPNRDVPAAASKAASKPAAKPAASKPAAAKAQKDDSSSPPPTPRGPTARKRAPAKALALSSDDDGSGSESDSDSGDESGFSESGDDSVPVAAPKKRSPPAAKAPAASALSAASRKKAKPLSDSDFDLSDNEMVALPKAKAAAAARKPAAPKTAAKPKNQMDDSSDDDDDATAVESLQKPVAPAPNSLAAKLLAKGGVSSSTSVLSMISVSQLKPTSSFGAAATKPAASTAVLSSLSSSLSRFAVDSDDDLPFAKPPAAPAKLQPTSSLSMKFALSDSD